MKEENIFKKTKEFIWEVDSDPHNTPFDDFKPFIKYSTILKELYEFALKYQEEYPENEKLPPLTEKGKIIEKFWDNLNILRVDKMKQSNYLDIISNELEALKKDLSFLKF